MSETGRTRRQSAERRGRFAEWTARAVLALKGYRLVAARYKTPVGEIDLILRRGRTVVFCEAQRRGDLTRAGEAVSPVQRRRIVNAAGHWMAQGDPDGRFDYRFDVVLVAGPFRVRHIANAFQA